jgi:putative spermidine/putrescine transport system ATP-binding protein
MSAQRTASGSTLRLESLTKVYRGAVAVHELSLDLGQGEFVTLLGPSGSGKTTTLMMVAGFVAMDSGRILLGDRDISRMPPHHRNLGVVFQSYALFPHMTVGENIAFPLEIRKTARGEVRRRVAAILDLVQLSGFEGRAIRELSGGQQQRVALARALVHNPPVLLMDEPLGALDRKLREQMQLEIKRIQRQLRITVLYVTHDRDEAMTMSDRIVVMHEGQARQAGAPREVYERPVSRFVAEFLGDANIFRAQVVSSNGSGCDVGFAAGGRLCGIRCDAAPGGSVVLAVRPERVRVARDAAGAVCSGVVEEVIYRGTVTRFAVRVPGLERAIQVEQTNAERGPEVGCGDEVGLAWRPADVSVLADAGAP